MTETTCEWCSRPTTGRARGFGVGGMVRICPACLEAGKIEPMADGPIELDESLTAEVVWHFPGRAHGDDVESIFGPDSLQAAADDVATLDVRGPRTECRAAECQAHAVFVAGRAVTC